MGFITTPVPGGKNTIVSIKVELISCICVTRGKPQMLKRALVCFTAQSYPKKELVIVYEDDDISTEELIKEAEIDARDDIQVLRVNSVPKTTLGELRNMAINAARGEFICQWDDDDWYHEDRLTEQYQIVKKHNSAGIVMTQWLVYNCIDNQAYISNIRIWEGSVLCKKVILQSVPYENKSIGEDTATIDYLHAHNYLHLLNNFPRLYIYVYHGSNTWNFEHWNEIFECSTALSSKHSQYIADILQGKYSVHEGSLLLNKILQTNPQKKIAI